MTKSVPIDCGTNVKHTLWSRSLDDTHLCGNSDNQFVCTNSGTSITLFALHHHNRSTLALWHQSGKPNENHSQ